MISSITANSMTNSTLVLKPIFPAYFLLRNSRCPYASPLLDPAPQWSTPSDNYERRQPAGARQSNQLIWTLEGKDPLGRVKKSRGDMRAKRQRNTLILLGKVLSNPNSLDSLLLFLHVCILKNRMLLAMN